MPTVSASAARRTLSAKLDRVEAGEEVANTRHHRVIAVLVRPDVLVARRAHEAFARAEQIRERLAQPRVEPLAAAAISIERAAELVEAVEAGRSAR